MKIIINLLLAVIMAVFCCSIGNAQLNYSNSLSGATLVYSNLFNGGAVDINGTAPTYINPGAPSYGGSLTAKFDVITNSVANGYYAYQDGTLGAKLNSVLLPFTPVNGYVYTLSAILTFTVTPPAGGYGGMGFAAHIPPSNSSVADPRMGSSSVGGNPWALLNMFANGGGALLNASGASQGGVPNLMTALNTPYTINLVLDTTGTHWVTTLYINGTLVKGYTYSSNPSLLAFGYTQTTTTAGAFKWGPMSLFASPMVLTEQPNSASVGAGTAFTNIVVVAASAPTYQWYYNSSSNYLGATALTNTPDGRVYGTTNSSLVITNIQASDGGYYFVVATNSLSSVTSSISSLTVFTNPLITAGYPVAYTNPMPLYCASTVSGTNYTGASPNFSVSVLGGLPLAYRWLTNGVAVGGATNASFSITNCHLTSPTDFTCIVSNSYGTATNDWQVSYVQTPLQPYPQQALAFQPFGYWRMDEWPDDGNGDDGVLAVDYAGGNNGIYTNAYFYAFTYSAITDPDETAVYFDAVASQSAIYGIQGVNFAAPTNNSATISVAAWVNDSSPPANNSGIVAKGYLGAEQFVMDISGGKYRFSVNDAAGVIHSAVASVGPNGTWQHVVGVCNEAPGTGNTNVAIYINGLLAANVFIPSGSGLLNSSVPMTIGARSTSATSGYDLQFNGIIDDVAVFNSALTAGQVAQLYASAGNSVPLSFVGTLPPTNAVYLANSTLTIPATVFGQPTIGYYWTNLTTGATIASGRTTAFANFNVGLTISNASASLSGDQLELVATNAISSTNWFVTLFSPAPPVTLSYTNQILYSNYFNGGTWSIAGMPLTAANMLVGGTNTLWDDALGTNDTGQINANGVDACTLGNSWVLPFTPHPGYIYTETVSVTLSGNPGNWFGVGYAQYTPTNAVSGRYGDIPSFDWIILTSSTANVQYFVGPGGTPAGGLFSANGFYTVVGTHTVQVVLDTTGAHWVMYAFVDGNGTITNTYSSNPPIGAVGITQNAPMSAPGDIQWNYVSLTQVAPGGIPPYTLAALPASVTLAADASLSIPATGFGSAPFGYSWSNTNTASVISSGATNNMAPLGANLSLPDVPGTWNGNTLALTLTNAYGTNITLVLLNVTNSTLIPTNPPFITGFSLINGTNVTINATNGLAGGTYYLLGSTNLMTPRSQWLPLATNVVLTNGGPVSGFTFNATNVIRVGNPLQFYILSNTN